MKRSDNTGSVPHEKIAVHSGRQTGVAVKREMCDMPPFGGIFLRIKRKGKQKILHRVQNICYNGYAGISLGMPESMKNTVKSVLSGNKSF